MSNTGASLTLFKELKRFLIVGGLTTGCNYLLFYMLWQWGLQYGISAIVGYCSGIAMGYILNKAWAFENKGTHTPHMIGQYVALYLITLGLNLMTLIILVEWIGIHALIANIFAIGVSTVANFIGLKLFVFADGQSSLLAEVPSWFHKTGEQLPPLKHPSVLLATWWGSGYIPLAPATVGTLTGMPFGYAIYAVWGQEALIGASMVALVVGVWACNAYSRLSGTHDSRHVVIDEVAAIWLVQAYIPQTLLSYGLAFVVFRVCDVLKPYPINVMDAKIKGGWGMMLDDTGAAIISLLILLALHAMVPIVQWNHWLLVLVF